MVAVALLAAMLEQRYPHPLAEVTRILVRDAGNAPSTIGAFLYLTQLVANGMLLGVFMPGLIRRAGMAWGIGIPALVASVRDSEASVFVLSFALQACQSLLYVRTRMLWPLVLPAAAVYAIVLFASSRENPMRPLVEVAEAMLARARFDTIVRDVRRTLLAPLRWWSTPPPLESDGA
jgi:hypothetical protein